VTRLAEEGAASWEAIADGWAERVRTGTDASRIYILDAAHLSLAGDVRGLRVLDAGCGEGRFARMLAERGATVTGIDFSPRMIELAREQEAKEPRGIRYAEADMASLSQYPDEAFDLAVAYVSLVDVVEYEKAITEVSRVLAPGGRFVFSLVHPCFSPPVFGWEPRTPGIVPLRDADKLFRKVDRYFPPGEVRFRMWPTAPAETINYHRPISHYAHACRAAGLFIRDIVEPTPDPEVVERLDWLKSEFRAPTFIIFDCVKAAA
jgi:SAM-dependent methyltransferase